MVASLTEWMLYAMWVILGLMGLNVLIGIVKALAHGKLDYNPILAALKDIVYYVLPLLLLAGFMDADQTGWIVLTFYYIGAVGVILKYLMDFKNKM